MATDKKKTDARDALDASTSSNEKGELNAITVNSLTNIEEKLESIDWKLWEIYNIVKNYVESNPAGASVSAPSVSAPQPSTADIAAEVAKALGNQAQPEEEKISVGGLRDYEETRYVVRLDVEFAGGYYNDVEFTIDDREDRTPILLDRAFMKRLNVLVNPQRKYVITTKYSLD